MDDPHMNWTLSWNREARNKKQKVNYSDKNKWKEMTNSEYELTPKKRKSKISRPTTPDDQLYNEPDPTVPRRGRGRPPRSGKPPSQHHHLLHHIPDGQKRKPGRPPTRRGAVSPKRGDFGVHHIDDTEFSEYYVDYAYEYEYYSEYDEPDRPPKIIKEEEVPKLENISPQISDELELTSSSSPLPEEVEVKVEPPPKVEEPAIPPIKQPSPPPPPPPPLPPPVMPPKIKPPPKKQTTKARPKSFPDFDIPKDDDDILIVQKIIGQKQVYGINVHPPQYFVKFVDRSYIHCRWMTRSNIAKYDNGENALKKFQAQVENKSLYPSDTIPHLLILDESEINIFNFKVDRIIKQSSNGNKNEYFIKWKEMEYESSTWESLDDLHNKEAYDEFVAREKIVTHRKGLDNYHFPPKSEYEVVTERPVSKHGDVFKDFQMEGLNYLLKSWFDHQYTILGDEVRVGKLPQAVVFLDHIKNRYNNNGPFLILTSANKMVNWKYEFSKWSTLNTVVFTGTSTSRTSIIENELNSYDDHGRNQIELYKAEVVITSYELFLNPALQFTSIEWQYIFADDGFKMSNGKSKPRVMLKQNVKFGHITLMMEWPLRTQNNIFKTYFILNFVDEPKYNNLLTFLDKYNIEDPKVHDELIEKVNEYILARDTDSIMDQMEPKKELLILCEPSELQKQMYLDAVKAKTEILLKPITDEADTPLIELINDMRDLCNHPYLLKNMHERSVKKAGDKSTVNACGKLYFISKLVPKVIEEGQKALIFAQNVRVLDVIEGYVNDNDIEFERIDCVTTPDDCERSIENFKNNPDCHVFLYSSKPGCYIIDTSIFDAIFVYDVDTYKFNVETKPPIYHLLTNGTFEMDFYNRNICFDDSPIDYMEQFQFLVIDAEQIELMLRDTITFMHETTSEKIHQFFTSSIEDIFNNCVHEKIDLDEGEINYTLQKAFWNQVLEPPKKAKINPTVDVNEVKQLIQQIIDRGYRGEIDELDLIKCALTLAPPGDTKSLDLLSKIVVDNNDDGPVKRFGPYAFMLDKMAPKLFEMVTFFIRLDRALYLASLDRVVWPSVKPFWEEPSCEYGLMYGLNEHGFKGLTMMIDDKELGLKNTKPLKRHQLEKHVLHLIQGLENQFSLSNITVPDNFKPMSPLAWKKLHPNLKHRTTLSDNEVRKLFKTILNFGLPQHKDYHINLTQLAKDAEILDVSVDCIELYADQIVNLALNPDDKYPEELSCLEGKVTDEQIESILFVIRHMGKIYNFLNDFNVNDEKIYSNVKINDCPSWWNWHHHLALLQGITQYGSKRLFKILVDPEKPFLENIPSNLVNDFKLAASQEGTKRFRYPQNLDVFGFIKTRNQRLKIAGTIIQQVWNYVEIRQLDLSPNPYLIISPQNLRIISFGKIVDHPNFMCKACSYPLAYTSEKFLNRPGSGIPQSWFRCEIQAAGIRPLFIVSPIDNLDKAFVGTTPIEAWSSLFESYISPEESEELISKLKLSGESLFGLAYPKVQEILKQMELEAGINSDAHEELSDESGDEEDGRSTSYSEEF